MHPRTEPQPIPGFILGTHEESWLADPRCAEVPLMVSDARLRERRSLPRAVGRWVLDSCGFTQLQQHGTWEDRPTPAGTVLEYVARARRYRDEIGGLAWAAPRDWMCEPWVIRGGKPSRTGPTFVGTHLSVQEHLRRTVASVLELRALAPDVPWIAVLQGWTLGDYLDCLELYDKAGLDLRREPVVGVGTMCRRESTISAGNILDWLADEGIPIHAFGLKTEGLAAHGRHLFSSDSLAWSDHARFQPPLEGHELPGPGRPRGHKRCNNCLEFALEWRANVVAKAGFVARSVLSCPA